MSRAKSETSPMPISHWFIIVFALCACGWLAWQLPVLAGAFTVFLLVSALPFLRNPPLPLLRRAR
jgi:hypothetical protein